MCSHRAAEEKGFRTIEDPSGLEGGIQSAEATFFPKIGLRIVRRRGVFSLRSNFDAGRVVKAKGKIVFFGVAGKAMYSA